MLIVLIVVGGCFVLENLQIINTQGMRQCFYLVWHDCYPLPCCHEGNHGSMAIGKQVQIRHEASAAANVADTIVSPGKRFFRHSDKFFSSKGS